MHTDAFSCRHPAVNFVFFLTAIVLGVTLAHPAYLIAALVCAVAYYLLLHGKKGVKTLSALIPLFAVLTLVNPLFNTYGEHPLFFVFGRPYTLESLLYGAAIALTFVATVIWFGCYNAVMTGDKFTSLFGNWIPSLSLLFVMVLRMVPNLKKKAAQIAAARSAIGKGVSSQSGYREKLRSGMAVLSALTSWALEGGVVTGDAMRSRGYGSAKRTSFRLYRMTAADVVLLALMLLLTAAVVAVAVTGGAAASFTPKFSVTPIRGANAAGFACYLTYLLIPTLLHIRRSLKWRIALRRA